MINTNIYLTGEEILPSDQTRMIKEGKFTHFLRKALKKNQTKTIEDQGGKQLEALQTLKPTNQ